MVHYRKILELHLEGVSQRTISSSTGHSRNIVSEVVQRSKKHKLELLDDTMTNAWLEVFLFPEKQPTGGRTSNASVRGQVVYLNWII